MTKIEQRLWFWVSCVEEKQKIPGSFVWVSLVLLCFLYLTDLIKCVKARVTRQPCNPYLIGRNHPSIVPEQPRNVFYVICLRGDRGGGRTATLAEATSCHVSAGTLQVKPVWRHSAMFPPPCWVFLFAAFVIILCCSPTVSSGGFGSSACACSFRSWPTTRLSRPSTRGWGLGSAPATGCTRLCTGWSTATRVRSSRCLPVTDHPSCQRHQNRSSRRLQQNQRSPEKMRSRRSRKNIPAPTPHTWLRYKATSARSWTTRTAGCPSLRRRTSLVSCPRRRRSLPRRGPVTTRTGPWRGATWTGPCQTWSGAAVPSGDAAHWDTSQRR